MNDRTSTYRFEYQLSYEEAYEAFSRLSFRWSRSFRLFIGIGLTAIAVIMLILFALDSQKIHFFFIAIVAVFMLAYLVYMPALKARKGASRVARIGGRYRLALSSNGLLTLAGSEVIDLKEEKGARAIETDDLFILRPNSLHTCCLPKRVMTEEEILGVRGVLSEYVKLQ